MSVRDIKRASRRRLHAHMKLAAIYIPPPHAAGLPVSIYVRVHSKSQALEMAGADDRATARIFSTPSLVFMRSELTEADVILKARGIVSVGSGEAYRLVLAEPPDDITVKWTVEQLTEKESDGLPVPDTSNG
jgi:hypothetical protein